MRTSHQYVSCSEKNSDFDYANHAATFHFAFIIYVLKIFTNVLQHKNRTDVKSLADQLSTENAKRLAEARRESMINGQVTELA
jgi:hypothetical protein